MKNRSHGFTLMELMVVLSVAAVILAIGAPNFNEFRRNNRLTGIANDFLGAIQTARGEAIKRQVPVAICPSDTGSAMNATCTTDTFRGWIAFVDTNNNCMREASEAVVRAGSRIDTDSAKSVYAVSSGVCISFAATGFRQIVSGKSPAGQTLFCDDRGKNKQAGTELSAARGIEVTPTGRARVTRVISELNDWTIGCP